MPPVDPREITSRLSGHARRKRAALEQAISQAREAGLIISAGSSAPAPAVGVMNSAPLFPGSSSDPVTKEDEERLFEAALERAAERGRILARKAEDRYARYRAANCKKRVG